jgi:hypothetical protein
MRKPFAYLKYVTKSKFFHKAFSDIVINKEIIKKINLAFTSGIPASKALRKTKIKNIEETRLI